MKLMSQQVDKIIKLISDKKCEKDGDSLFQSLQTPL